MKVGSQVLIECIKIGHDRFYLKPSQLIVRIPLNAHVFVVNERYHNTFISRYEI